MNPERTASRRLAPRVDDGRLLGPYLRADEEGPAPAHVSRGQGYWNLVALWVLPLVAAVGAILSWGSLYRAATDALGQGAPVVHGVNLVGAAFPLLVDALILGASARYVAGVKAARPVAGWRLAAHAGVVGTVLLNADAAPTAGDIPWHVTAPIVWSVLVELVARDVLGQLQEVRDVRGNRIPARLWLTAPAESVRVSWRMARTGSVDVEAVRAETERRAAARDQLAVAVPSLAHRRLRRQITRRLWAGALDPAALAHLIDTTPHPAELHRAVLRTVATGGAPVPHPVPAPRPGRQRALDTASAVVPKATPPTRTGGTSRLDRPPVHPRAGEDDAPLVAAVLAIEPLPSARQIKATHRIGQARAARIRALAVQQLAASAASQPGTPPAATNHRQNHEQQHQENEQTSQQESHETSEKTTDKTTLKIIKSESQGIDEETPEETQQKAESYDTHATALP